MVDAIAYIALVVAAILLCLKFVAFLQGRPLFRR